MNTLLDSDIIQIYDLVAAVYQLAIREAQGRHERKREDAIEWLVVVAPDWRERLSPVRCHSRKTMSKEARHAAQE